MEAKELTNRFTYHSPKGDQPYKYEELRNKGRELVELILEYSKESREQSLAITKIEEAIMWANAGIARND